MTPKQFTIVAEYPDGDLWIDTIEAETVEAALPMAFDHLIESNKWNKEGGESWENTAQVKFLCALQGHCEIEWRSDGL